MGYKEGANLTVDFMYPYQHFDRMKNNWRMSGVMAFMTSAVPGMVVSEEDDDTLHHKLEAAAAWDEILQATSSHAADPIFRDLTVRGINILTHENEVLVFEDDVLTFGY